MRTRYKIIAVIGIFTLFYVQLPLIWQQCNGTGTDCTILTTLMNWTRMEIFSSGAIEWNGTAQWNQQNQTIYDYLEINQNFILTMIVVPTAIIFGIMIWDTRKWKPDTK